MVDKKIIKVCNAYSGIGGNRKNWTKENLGFDIEVTAVEYDPQIAAIYQDFFPDDKVIVADAHQYLLDHYKSYDFIWSSPPCPSHSDIRRCGVHAGQNEALYPDMALYQEIILLQNFAPKDCKWVVENVKPYYKPLISGKLMHRHLFWSNFNMPVFVEDGKRKHSDITGNKPVYGFDLSKYDFPDKRKLMRNMVDPELGLHIFKEAFTPTTLF